MSTADDWDFEGLSEPQVNGSPQTTYKALHPGYKVWTPPEIWAPIPPPIYAIGTLTQGDVAMMCAHGSSLKSWAGINAVLAVATGGQWLERGNRALASAALYLDAEMGPDECRRRFQRNALAMGLSGPVNGVSMVSLPGFSLGTSGGVSELRRLAEGQTLIVVDSLAAFSPGVPENDAAFAEPLNAMKLIGGETKCAFLVLHHSRKGNGQEDEDARERPRGTSALFAACDVVFQLSKSDDGFTMVQTKSRKGKAADDVVLRVEDMQGTEGTGEGTRVYGEAPSTEDTASAFGKAKSSILVLLANDHDCQSANDIYRRLRGKKAIVLSALNELEERGLVARHQGAIRLASEVGTR